MKKFTQSKIFRWAIALLVVVTVIIVIAISSNNAKKSAAAELQTQVLEKGDLTAIVGATGTARANQSATLVWQTSGRIEQISAGVGEKVKADQVLATLAESSLPQSIILAQSDLVTAQRNLDDLLNSNAATAQAQLNLANAQDNYDSVRWNAVYDGQIPITSADNYESIKASVVIAEQNVKNAQQYYDFFAGRNDDDAAKASALISLNNVKKELSRAQAKLDFFNKAPDASEVSISEGEVAVAKAQLDDAQREWERLKDGSDPADIAAARARVAAIEATINMAKVTAPFSGTITESNGMIGDLVSPNTSAFRIDDLSSLFIDVYIPEVDINRIKIGQDVTLSFDAISLVEYQGKVTEVAQVGTSSSGSVDFKVTLEVLNADDQVKPGMTAAVNIVVSNVKDALIVPNRAVRMVDGQYVIYLLKNGVPTKVDIVIGSSSDSYSEVLSGDVKAGDILILNPSTSITDLMSSMSPR